MEPRRGNIHPLLKLWILVEEIFKGLKLVPDALDTVQFVTTHDEVHSGVSLLQKMHPFLYLPLLSKVIVRGGKKVVINTF